METLDQHADGPIEPEHGAPLTGGEVLAIADDHRRGLHDSRQHPRCSRCLLERVTGDGVSAVAHEARTE